jgi:hypothetical protein
MPLPFLLMRAVLLLFPLRGALCALLAHYTFDVDFSDSSGFGHTGTGVGAGIGVVADAERGNVLDVSDAADQLSGLSRFSQSINQSISPSRWF